MEYRRKIQDSDYYKEYINSLNIDIQNKLDYLYELQNEKNKKLKEFFNLNNENIESYTAYKNMKEKLCKKISRDLRIKDSLFAVLFIGIISFSVIGAPEHVDDSIISSLYPMMSVLGLSGLATSIAYACVNSPGHVSCEGLFTYFRKKRYSKIRKEYQKKFNDYSETCEKREQSLNRIYDINSVSLDTKEKIQELIKIRDNSIKIAEGYDNITPLQRMKYDNIRKLQEESYKPFSKTLKKDYTKYYQTRIRSH